MKRPNTPYEINIEDLQNTEPENTIAVNLNDKVNDDQRLGFRLALLPVNSYFPSLASKPPQTNESDTTLYAISRPKLPTQYLIDGMDDPSDLAIEAVYVNKDVVVEPFFLPESKFPSTIGSRDTQELVLNPPQAVLVLHHPEFDSANLFERFQCIFMDSCNIVCCEAGKSDTGALVFPTNAPRSDGDYTLPSNEDLKLGQYGALGLAFFGPVTVEDMARLAQRISGRYILPIRMSTQICQHLFVPRTPYAPNSNTYSVQHLKAETDGVPTILKSVPLFLVSEVVFPGATSVFTIFELRYKAMIKDHLDHGQVFGIVQRGEEVGTLVRVESVISVDPETGETQVVVRGLRRFRRDAGALRRLEGEKFGLFVADVKLHDDDDCYKDVLNSEGEVEVEGQGQGQSALNVSPGACVRLILSSRTQHSLLMLTIMSLASIHRSALGV